MSVYFYFPLNFTHCWVSLLTDCLWWCWRSTSTAEEAVHITLPRCSISPCRTSTYLISLYEAHSHPSVHMCNLPPTWDCSCLMHLSGCCCRHPRKTERTLHLYVRWEVWMSMYELWRLLAPFCPLCAKPSNQYSFALYSQTFQISESHLKRTMLLHSFFLHS